MRTKGLFIGLIVSLVTLVTVHQSAVAHPGSGIVVDAQGRVFFTSGPMIIMVETNGAARTIVHDQKNEKFYQLHHIQRAPDGGWLTASDMGNAIWHFKDDGELIRFYPPPNEDRALHVGAGGDPFAVDGEGNVFAVNSRQDRFTQIFKITADGRISVLAGGDWGYADGRGTEAKFGDLHGGSMLVMPDGVLLLTDHSVRVRRVARDGNVTTLAGAREAGSVDGPAASARFDGASGLAVDAQGNVLVVDHGEPGNRGGRIRSITPDRMVKTLAGSGRPGVADGPLLEAKFNGPTGIAVAPNGDLFVLEPDEPRVRKISGGRVTTVHKGTP